MKIICFLTNKLFNHPLFNQLFNLLFIISRISERLCAVSRDEKIMTRLKMDKQYNNDWRFPCRGYIEQNYIKKYIYIYIIVTYSRRWDSSSESSSCIISIHLHRGIRVRAHSRDLYLHGEDEDEETKRHETNDSLFEPTTSTSRCRFGS